MKNGGWIPLSKSLFRSLPNYRKFSEIEAAFCLQFDYDNGNTATLSGYSSLWRWSTDKVRRFLLRMGVEISYLESTAKKQNQRGLLKPCHKSPTSYRDRNVARMIFPNNLIDLSDKQTRHQEEVKKNYDQNTGGLKDDQQTINSINLNTLDTNPIRSTKQRKMSRESKHPTTVDPNPDPDIKNLPLSGKPKREEGEAYRTKNDKFITGQQLEWFNKFWEAWSLHDSYKKGKADAGDAWLKQKIDEKLFFKIIKTAEIESSKRRAIKDKGSTPIYPQGWLSGRRWEDYEGDVANTGQEARAYDVESDLIKEVEQTNE